MAGGARDRVLASVPVAGPLELPAHLDHARVQVDELPAKTDRLSLADADRERDRPPGAIAPAHCRAKDLTGLLPGQRLDIHVLADRRVDHGRYIPGDLASFPCDLQGAGDDPVDLHNGVGLEALFSEPGVERSRCSGCSRSSRCLPSCGTIQRRTLGSYVLSNVLCETVLAQSS